MRSPRQQKWNSLLMVHGAIYRQQIHCLCQLTGNWSVSIEPIHLSAGHNSFSTNGPIHWNDCRDNHGLWLSFSRLLLSEHQPWGQKHNRLDSPFLCAPTPQVHNCFEWPNRFSTIVSAQQNISRDSRAKFTFPDTRLCQRYRRSRFSSLSSLDGFSRCSAQLAAHLREMKCKYVRKVCFFLLPSSCSRTEHT